MNDFQIRAFVRQLIAEAKAKKANKKDDKKPAKKDDKKEPKLPKSSGKLMDLKKEVAYLKEMSAQLQATGITEGDGQVAEVEFSNLQKFVNELSKVKAAGAELKKKLDEEITATEAKIKAEKDKIKEIIGLVSEESTVVSENKLTKKDLEAALKDKGIKLKDFIKDPKKYPEFNKFSSVTKDIIDSIYSAGVIDYDKLDEKLKPSMGAGTYVKDFEKSKAPQFKGKSKAKKQKMAVAAYLTAKDKK